MTRPDTDTELYYLAFSRASHGGESREVRLLRDFTHARMLAGLIDGATQDRIGELLDAISSREIPKVGDWIAPGSEDIRWDVLEVVDDAGDTWHRVFGDDRYADDEDDGGLDRSQEYDWRNSGGWSTTEGVLDYAPLRVTKVACRPEDD
ncbi:hypothetical protein I0C86_40470 [Plantactinospora sp. S1510]|uniref:Uncharacterized protein n=1 Tax=Plantactinospora alkalitolerans TaxID=2789879 RepID=A0ABS0H9K3_9ACTN|nr:hypothetical protein [Plantactinospora alkalitolerans]MBF9135156.1 hypothetical protein [Plantactinospora alkalitolerans]